MDHGVIHKALPEVVCVCVSVGRLGGGGWGKHKALLHLGTGLLSLHRPFCPFAYPHTPISIPIDLFFLLLLTFSLLFYFFFSRVLLLRGRDGVCWRWRKGFRPASIVVYLRWCFLWCESKLKNKQSVVAKCIWFSVIRRSALMSFAWVVIRVRVFCPCSSKLSSSSRVLLLCAL